MPDRRFSVHVKCPHCGRALAAHVQLADAESRGFWGKLGAMLLAVVGLGACRDTVVSPDPPDMGGGDPPPPPDPGPPRVDEPCPLFSGSVRGYTAFALSIYDEAHIRAVCEQALAYGYNMPRVLAEHRTWSRHGLPDSPPVESPEALENLRRLLETTARIPGCYLLLCAIGNLKEDGASMTKMLDWVELVGRVVMGDAVGGLKATEPFRHVVFEAVNEAWHPASSLRDEGKVNQLIARIRNIAHGYPVTTDDNFSRPEDITYNRAYNGSFADCHPWRWRATSGGGWERFVPTRDDYRRMVERNGKILVSEPICYDEFEDSRGCTNNRGLVEKQRQWCEEAGAVWTFHSRRGLVVDSPLGWMP